MITTLKLYNSKQTQICAYHLLPTQQYVYQNKHYVTVHILVLHSKKYLKSLTFFDIQRTVHRDIFL